MDLRISYKTGREGAKQAKPATVWPCVARAAANLQAAKTAVKELDSKGGSPPMPNEQGGLSTDC